MDGMEDKQAAPMPSPAEPPAGPVDLAQAFQMLNKANRETAEEPVATGEDAGQSGGEQVSDNGLDQEAGNDEGGEPAAPVAGSGQDVDDGVGGSAVGLDAIDFDSRKQELLRSIQQSAIADVRRDFQEKNIGYYSIAELRVEDEQTGRVRYRNPDVRDERDPDYYFKSRLDAQGYVDSWNKGVDNEFRKAVNEEQAKAVQAAAPTIQLIDFVPKYNAMDETTRKVFDSLIEPYTVYDNAGKEIGFNVNLDAAARQAEAIAKQFRPQKPQQQDGQDPAKQASSPAMDMATGNGKAKDKKEPTTIGEAMKMLNEQRKGN